MSSVSSVGGTNAANETAAATKSETEIDKDEFLSLLVAQMKNQNPESPTNSQEYVSEMAEFSTLEQITNVATSMEEEVQMGTVNQSLSLIGHKVSYLNEAGETLEGTVESVQFEEESFTLTINGESGISPGYVTEVE